MRSCCKQLQPGDLWISYNSLFLFVGFTALKLGSALASKEPQCSFPAVQQLKLGSILAVQRPVGLRKPRSASFAFAVRTFAVCSPEARVGLGSAKD